MSYLGESFGDNGDVGVGTFRRGGANLLIRTPSTGISLASSLGFRAWAVLWEKLAGVLCHNFAHADLVQVRQGWEPP